MKHIIATCLLMSAAPLVVNVHSATGDKGRELVFYVSPKGDDRWSGKRPDRGSPARQTKSARPAEGPFATLGRVRDAIRELKSMQGGRLQQPVTVRVRGGTYFLREPLTFLPEDSGTREFPITYSAYRNERPIISGGQRIGGWRQIEGMRPGIWTARIPEAVERRWIFYHLWVNEQRRVRARHPNRGYLRVAEALEVTPQTPWHEGQTRFRFQPGDLKAWDSAREAEVVVMSRWVESHLPIESVDEANCTVNLRKRSVFQLGSGDPYYVEHALEALDTPGEWYLDRPRGLLHYLPMPGEDMRRAEVIAPHLEQVVRLEGKPEASKYVQHLNFRGLEFSHTQWYFPEGSRAGGPKPDVGGFSQAAVGVPGAIYGEGVRDCALDGCTVAHVGNYGIELSRGCSNNRIAQCSIYDLGGGGIKIGETTIRDNESEQTHSQQITDCRIHHGGHFFHSAIGVWMGQSYNNLLAHNEIHDFYYTGISIGWTWGYGKALARGNTVEFNHVHHIGVQSDGDGPILSDMGGIYTLGTQPGTVVRSNLWHDIAGLRYGGWGIYFDEGSTGIIAENNLVYRTTHGGFHQHYGKDNIVRDNVFAFSRDHQLQASRAESHRRFTFEHNIVYWKEGAAISGSLDFNFVFDRNLYWCAGDGKMQFVNLSWNDWREKGVDANSTVSDPLFVAPAKDDFRLRPESPAVKLGFVVLDTKTVGPR